MTKVKRNYVATEHFYVTTELARIEGILVAIEDFIVATELATIESFAAQDVVGQAKAGKHDRPWARTKGVRRAQQRRARDRGVLPRQTCPVARKKK